MRTLVSAFALMSLTAFSAQAQSDGKFFEPDPMSLTEAMFQSMDVNLNGTLSNSEVSFFYQYLSLVLDEDDSGLISPPEFARNYSAMMPIPMEMLSDGEEQIESEFNAFDANADGVLTADEIVARFADEIAALDKDGNALISIDEYADFSAIKFYNALEAQFVAEEEA